MRRTPSSYRKTYEMAQRELADLLTEQQRVEKRIVVVRKSLQTLAELCENEGVEIEPSKEAAYLLENTNLADEIRSIIKSVWPEYLRPVQIKDHLERLGHDLSKYQNPQATIQMVLKRMAESGDVQEGTAPEDGKKTYRISAPSGGFLINFEKMAAMLRKNPALGEMTPGIAAMVASARAVSQMEKDAFEKPKKK